MTHTVQTPAERLDKYLAAQNLATSRSEATQWISEGRVLVNGKAAKAATPLKGGETLEIQKPDLRPLALTAHAVDFAVVYEDEHLLVINKPAGLVVHPGAGHYETSLVHGLLHHCQDSLSGIGGVERPGIVHRLDKGTSGLMVVAKTDVAHQNLTQQFQNRQVQKEYRAITLGSIAKTEQTLIDLMKRSDTNRKKFVVNQKKGKQAITHVRVLKKNEKFSFVSVKIETGRTHQIRVHLRSINHPIVGDELYGGTQKLSAYTLDAQQRIKALGHPLLHSQQLQFAHPLTGKSFAFVVEPPEDFLAFLTQFLP